MKSARPPFCQPPSSTRLGSAALARVRKRLISDLDVAGLRKMLIRSEV